VVYKKYSRDQRGRSVEFNEDVEVGGDKSVWPVPRLWIFRMPMTCRAGMFLQLDLRSASGVELGPSELRCGSRVLSTVRKEPPDFLPRGHCRERCNLGTSRVFSLIVNLAVVSLSHAGSHSLPFSLNSVLCPSLFMSGLEGRCAAPSLLLCRAACCRASA
jgi:hypothetical protein